MSWVGVAATVVSTGVKIGTSIHQKRQAKKLEEGLVEPVYNIPKSATDALNTAKAQTMSRDFAGQDQAMQRLEQGTANSTSDILKGGSNSGDVLSSLIAVQGNNAKAQNDMAYYAANDYRDRVSNLERAQNRYAEYEAIKQDRDVYDKFNRDAAAISALRYGAMNNMNNGVNQLADGAMYLNSVKKSGEIDTSVNDSQTTTPSPYEARWGRPAVKSKWTLSPYDDNNTLPPLGLQ